MSEAFRFKRFSVVHDRAAMKVGTDAVLLGMLAELDESSNILDVGTGSGVIALMLAQRNSRARILGIDINQEAVAQAADNFKNSPWSSRLTSLEADFAASDSEFFDSRKASFDTIVSNPPFFPTAPLSMSSERREARISETLTFAQLISGSSLLLRDGGTLQVIIPTPQVREFVFTAWQHDLRLYHRIDICTKASKPAKRSVLLFRRSSLGPVAPVVENTLVMLDSEGKPTDDYSRLTAPFYL